MTSSFSWNRRFAWLIGCCAALTVLTQGSLGQSSIDADDDDQDATASQSSGFSGPSSAPNPVLRSQLLTLTPYISLYNPLIDRVSPETPADVLDRFKRMEEMGENAMDAHTQLQTAWRDVRAFLVASRNRITPAVAKAQAEMPTPVLYSDDPEVNLVLATWQVMMEWAKQHDLVNWLTEYDRKCQLAYRAIFPLLEREARGEAIAAKDVRVTSGYTKQQWVFLQAVNASQTTLTNVSLRVKLATLDKRACDHFYFIPEWQAGKVIPLRAMREWEATVGSAATTSAVITLVSDEVKLSNIRCTIDDHIPTAADGILAEVEAHVRTKRKPKIAINRLDAIKPAVSRYKDRADRMASLRATAQSQLDVALSAVDERVNKVQRDLATQRESHQKLLNQRAKATPARAKEIDKQIADLKLKMRSNEAKLKDLRNEREDWVAGRR